MAINTDNLILYSDIYALFSSLNTVRATHALEPVITPESLTEGSIIKNEVPAVLKEGIESTVDSHISAYEANTDVLLPKVGQLLSPAIFTRFSSVISTIANVCHDKSHNNNTCFGGCTNTGGGDGGDTCTFDDGCSFSFGFSECNQSSS